MASLVTILCVPSSRDRDLSSRSDQAFSNRLFNIKPFVAVKSKRELKAMGAGGGGGAKFKGTQRREKQLTEMIEKKVIEAKQVCEGDETSDECKVAWDEVEEVSQAKADLRLKLEKQDPLEYYCQDNPETDECRVYED